MKPIDSGRPPVTFLRLALAFCVMTIFSTMAIPENARGRESLPRENGYATQSLPSGVFQFDRDARLTDILDQRPTSVESFLALVPDFVRQNHTLISQSGSIQYSSLTDPRAVLSTPTASLVLTFTGHDAVSGGRSIEAMEYNLVTDRYDFHEISWTGGRMTDVTNPHKCTACHTENYMPNWRPYHDWRESFGTINDHFGNAITHTRDRFGRPSSDYVTKAAHEAEFEHFIATKATNGERYKFLTAPSTVADVSRWPFGSYDFSFNRIDIEPNRRLGVGLIFHWSRSLGARLEKTRLFHDHAANLVAGLLECNGRDPEFEAALSRANLSAGLTTRPSFEIPKVGVSLHGPFELGPKINRFYDFLNSLAAADVSPEAWATNYVVRDSKLSTENLLLDNGQTSFSGFEEMNEVPLLTGLYLVGSIARGDRTFDVPVDPADDAFAERVGVPVKMLVELGKIIPLYGTRSIVDRVCPKLVARARTESASSSGLVSETSTRLRTRLTEWSNGRPYVIQRCAACHDHQSFEGAPLIPFDHPDQLRGQLRADGGALLENIRARTAWTAPDDLRMPKGAYAMPPAQRRQLLRYLKQIQAGS